MAHADYNCCAICDCKLYYVGCFDSETKEEICSSCIFEHNGKLINNKERLIELINSLSSDDLISLLKNLFFNLCFYSNDVDEAVKARLTSEEFETLNICRVERLMGKIK